MKVGDIVKLKPEDANDIVDDLYRDSCYEEAEAMAHMYEANSTAVIVTVGGATVDVEYEGTMVVLFKNEIDIIKPKVRRF